jgi:hypothetical protein
MSPAAADYFGAVNKALFLMTMTRRILGREAGMEKVTLGHALWRVGRLSIHTFVRYLSSPDPSEPVPLPRTRQPAFLQIRQSDLIIDILDDALHGFRKRLASARTLQHTHSFR